VHFRGHSLVGLTGTEDVESTLMNTRGLSGGKELGTAKVSRRRSECSEMIELRELSPRTVPLEMRLRVVLNETIDYKEDKKSKNVGFAT